MKSKVTKINRAQMPWLMNQPVNVQMELLQHHFEIMRIFLNSFMEQEVCQYTGARYEHDKPHGGRYDRWGFNPGSVQVGNQKLRLEVPRVYDRKQGRNKTLSNYEQVRELPEQDDKKVKALLHGISMRDYGAVVDRLQDSLGLSASTLSRDFREATRRQLKEFENRSLKDENIVAIFMDGKHLASEQMVIALGIDDKGRKRCLGVVQTTTENHRSIKELLKDLITRGLSFEKGLLFIIDGSKGLRKAIQETLGRKAVVQRCVWHKRENVISYLSEFQKEHYRKKLQKAYREEEYEVAKEKLLSIKGELEQINHRAAGSLEEGLEETLTLQRLRLFETFGRSFSTTNCIENLNSQMMKYIGRVKNWQSSDQRYRWVVAGMMESERKMKKVCGWKKMYLMQEVIEIETSNKKRRNKNAA